MAVNKAKVSAERVTTGIPGLDEMMEGGFVQGSTILITGGTGSGKTTFCAQFILEGLKKGQAGIFLSLEEDPEEIKTDLKKYGFDFSAYEKKGIFKILYQNPFEVSDVSSTIIDSIHSIDAKRVVLDPVSLLGMYMKDPAVIRKRLFEIIRVLKKAGATALITSEILDSDISEGSRSLSRFGVIEFIVDSVIVLHHMGIGGESFGNIQIRKMRRTNHSKGWFPLNVTPTGLSVSKEEVSTLLK